MLTEYVKVTINDKTTWGIRMATETAVLGGGCFWCTEAVYQEIKGVEYVASGYTGGHIVNPTYEQVSSHTTGHAEAVPRHSEIANLLARKICKKLSIPDPPG